MKLINILLVIALSMFIFSSCSDDDDDGDKQAGLNVKLTDAPGDYEHVYIDVQDVKIKYAEDSTENGWETLDHMYADIYDLLEYTDGKEVLIADSEIGTQTIQQIRLILGEENTVVVDGETYDLTIPSGSESGLKIKIKAEIETGVAYDLVLDFDADKSIHKTGNDEYKLKPVIKASIKKIEEEKSE